LAISHQKHSAKKYLTILSQTMFSFISDSKSTSSESIDNTDNESWGRLSSAGSENGENKGWVLARGSFNDLKTLLTNGM